MRFLIVTHVQHKKVGNSWYAYEPYVKEMNLWLKHVESVSIIAPVIDAPLNLIDVAYQHPNINFIKAPAILFNSFSDAFLSLYYLPRIFYNVIREMHRAQHIHLRCPGNMGLIGCIAQIFFPAKIKTAKYAGNWDFKSKQPFTYRMQQALLRNTFITKNMTALIYGQWPDHTKNTRSFFTASYTEADKNNTAIRTLNAPLKLIFAGTLNAGKQPMLSARVCYQLIQKGIKAELHFYGEGKERESLEGYIEDNNLRQAIFLHGNQPPDVLKKAFKESHFLVFISRSEGWPKAVAEAMWWGCLPITSYVSCVPEMVGYGERGQLVEDSEEAVCKAIETYLNNPDLYRQKCTRAIEWARNFTLERFESEIKTILIA